MMERSPFSRQPIDTLEEARRCCDIYQAYKIDRDQRTGNKSFLNMAVENAKRDMDAAVAANRRMIVKVWDAGT
jgi:hypothetical protein